VLYVFLRMSFLHTFLSVPTLYLLHYYFDKVAVGVSVLFRQFHSFIHALLASTLVPRSGGSYSCSPISTPTRVLSSSPSQVPFRLFVIRHLIPFVPFVSFVAFVPVLGTAAALMKFSSSVSGATGLFNPLVLLLLIPRFFFASAASYLDGSRK